jgi:hypothetical protein
MGEPLQSSDLLGPATDAELLDLCGPQLLSWMLADKSLEEVKPQDESRMRSKTLLRETLGFEIRERRLQAWQQPPWVAERNRRLQLTQLLSLPPTDNDRGLAVRLRQQSGGDLPARPDGDDALLVSLFHMALDAFPLQLLPRGDERRAPFDIGTASFYRHPWMRKFRQAALEADNLGALFNDPKMLDQTAPESLDDDTHLMWSDGTGGTLQLAMIPQSALHFTFTRMHLDNRYAVEHLGHYLLTTVNLMRALAQKRPARVPLIVGLDNVALGPTVSKVPLPQGQLIPVDRLAGRLPSLTGATSALLLEVDLQLVEVESRGLWDDDTGVGTDASVRWRRMTSAAAATERQVSREVTKVRLAMALTPASEGHLAPVLRSQLILHPLSGGGGSWSSNPHGVSALPAAVIDDHVGIALAQWARRTAKHPDSMVLGARRLVSAMAERLDPLDGIIDAIICWENILGADSEVSFRVCGGLAMLLEPSNAEVRLQLFQELKKLYSVRSGLVHGSREPSPADAQRHRKRAIEVAIKAMRAVYERADLFECRNSDERNKRLLLGS